MLRSGGLVLTGKLAKLKLQKYSSIVELVGTKIQPSVNLVTLLEFQVLKMSILGRR